MNPANESGPRDEMLEAIANEFKNHKASSAKRTPDKVKALAISALAKGFSRSHVARAAGVSPKTIDNWRAAARPKAKRLRVVASAGAACDESAPQGAAGVIRARLASGVELEFRREALDARLLSLFANVGGAGC